MEDQKKNATKRKKVLVVGAGAAGMSCAHHLANHPDLFEVTLIDAVGYCGGQAFSIPLDKQKTGASWLNQGVQGGSYIFHHTLTAFARQGYAADPVELQVAFGKGDQYWSNVHPSKLLAKHEKEVRRFAWMLKIVRMFEVFFALLPIKYLIKIFRFSEEFANVVALPIVALFLGTGNYAPEVPSMVMERLCTSPTYGMWYPPDKNSVASNLPPMVVFPNFSDFYEAWRKDLVKKGVNVRLSTELTGVTKRDKTGVTVKIVNRTPAEDGHNRDSAWVPGNIEERVEFGNPSGNTGIDADKPELTEEYDEIVLCTLTDTAKRLLEPTITSLERRVLGSAKFANDITVTHQDADYMRNHYECFYNEENAVTKLNGEDMTKRDSFAKENFKPMYLIKMYPQDLSKLEMCFDCTNYQAQFPPAKGGKETKDSHFDKHVFQTIFLNKERDGHLWSMDEIDKSKIIRSDWWHQLCHSWTHYVFVVPWLQFLQGKRRTHYAGAWTLVNAHETACISGISAAVNLGATYPEDLERDRFAFLSFRLYNLLVYGKWIKRNVTKGCGQWGLDTGKGAKGEGAGWATGIYGSTYNGPGAQTEMERRIWREEVKAGRSLDGF